MWGMDILRFVSFKAGHGQIYLSGRFPSSRARDRVLNRKAGKCTRSMGNLYRGDARTGSLTQSGGGGNRGSGNRIERWHPLDAIQGDEMTGSAGFHDSNRVGGMLRAT